MKPVFFALLPMLLTMPVMAHVGMAGMDQAKTAFDASAALSWRSDGAIDKDQAWRIPGIMTGGEAWPVEEGVAVDEVTLQLYHALNANWYGVLKAGTHGAGSDDHGGIQLEHAYIGWNCCSGHASNVNVELGKLMAMFSPGIAQHSADRVFSESALALDAFLGRHFHDEGARITWLHENGLSIGAEVWRGKAYPATSGNEGGSYDVFAKYQFHGEHIMLTAGAWLMKADAALRSDHRYAGHDHDSAFAVEIPDVRFSGSSELWGLHGSARWHINHHWALSVEGEWMQLEADGDITDGSRQADLYGDYMGGWLQAGVHWHTHTFSVRAEELVLKNQLTGTGAPILLNDANLASMGKNPSRLSVGWHWQFMPSLAFRVEGVQDDSMLDERSRIMIGVVWNDRIWSRD